MDPSTFLARVCPDGLLVLAKKVEREDRRGRPYNTFVHKVAQGPVEAARCVKQMLMSKKDVYYALASFKQGFHIVEKNGKTKKVIRVRSNVDMLKSIWFDIDFKHGLENEREVILALRGFCKTISLPAPSILVHSGNGVHAYWPMAEAIPYTRWQVLADALKEAAKKTGLQADLACTADACRVLRPPKTINWKDPDNPKRVKILYSDERLFTPEELETCLMSLPLATPDQHPGLGSGSVPAHLKGIPTASEEFTSGLNKSGKSAVMSAFSNVVTQCAVSAYHLETHGENASEPEWTAILQLLRHCEDGQFYLHDVSSGHPDYDAEDTDEKFAQRSVENGPTLCATFEQYRPELCGACPHHNKIKTPIFVGQTTNTPVIGMPQNYKRHPKGGVQVLKIDEDGVKTWEFALRHNIDNLVVTKSMTDHTEALSFDIWLEGAVVKTIEYPSYMFGNPHKSAEHLSGLGIVFVNKEPMEFKNLMATWLGQLQQNRKVIDVAEQLGWISTKEDDSENEVLTGFSCGDTTYHTDGREERGVRIKKEFANIAVHYEPKGRLDPWKEVAAFLAEQDHPALTATLATAFASPILRFTGQVGATFTIVSQESGVGKTSALKTAQAVWGSPTHAVNSVNDTPLSVARKVGFINNLPAYWDELRGKETIESFLTLIFQISQGKEKSRLNSSAEARESRTWETMLVAASNDSIFDAMGDYGKGSDAGVARTFEVTMTGPADSTKSIAETAMLFEKLNSNFGHAGRIYAEYLANNIEGVEKKVTEIALYLDKKFKQRASERFWFAMMASLLAGAYFARKCKLVEINTTTLLDYLGQNLMSLRGRCSDSMASSDPMELVVQYVQAHQDRVLVVDEFPAPKQNSRTYVPTILGMPKADRIIVWRSKKDQQIRFATPDFTRWVEARGMNGARVIKLLVSHHHAVASRLKLALGTKYELGSQRVVTVPWV